MLIIAICLAIFGAAAGSFVSACVWRLHQQAKKPKSTKLSIVNGRSMCPGCGHQLAAVDLIPIISWISLRGRCRYCKNPIGYSYLVNELVAAFVFAASYLWWPYGLTQSGQKFLLASWLAVSVGLMALAIYDLRWQLLPNRLIYPTALVAIGSRFLYIVLFSSSPAHNFGYWLGAVAVASGIFWLLYHLSGGKWIGYGDVRLGFITGSVLATPQKALLMIFLASILGSLVALPSLLSGRRNMNSKIAYGPFLIVATAICVLFGDSILNWYQHFLS